MKKLQESFVHRLPSSRYLFRHSQSAISQASAMAATIAPSASWPGMMSYAGPAICCARDGGAGVLMSLQSAVSLWEQPFGRGGMQGVGGSSFGGGLQSRFPGQPVELSGAIRRNQGWQVNVAADHSGSKPEAHKRRGKWGYHPLEGLTKHEREAMQAGNGRPSDADVARTITEVNWSAIIMSSDVTDEDSVLGTEVHYLVDERGDFIFEMNDDSEFLSNLSSSQTFTVLIGFGPMDEIQITDMIEEVGEGEDEDSDLLEDDSDDSEEEEDLEDFDEQFWQEMVAGAPPDLLQEGLSPESLGSLGGWGGPDTLQWVHPMEFANKIVQAMSVDHTQDMNKPTKRLTIKGIVRKVTEEEEPYVQSLWYDRFLWDEDEDIELEEEYVGGERGSKLGDKNSNARTRVNGAASTSRTTAQGPGMGKINSKNGTKRTGNKSDSKVNVSRQKNGNLSSSSRGVTISDSSMTTSSVVNIQDPRRGETDASNVGTSASGASLSNDQTLQVGSRIEDLEICGKGDGEESSEGGDALEGEWTDEDTSEEVGTTFYKLEMISIELDSSSGLQTSIEVQEFCDGEPDILAHCSAAIIDRMNSAGSKTEEALKALCRREKGLEVEEVAVSGVDCLGVELRVSAGIEIQTLRFQFNRKATCEKVADQMIDQLLYPRPGQKRPRKGQQRPSRR